MPRCDHTGQGGRSIRVSQNGIRIGDLVEINGVTGEVVELGIFYTVLLETGSWNESGHPTGRRVTFTNGFAIEGHYFNFSTSGQWLWDEVHVDVPVGTDPYPIMTAIRQQVEAATADSARQAEAEWKGTRRSPRYITRASERGELRSKIYQMVVNMRNGVPQGVRDAESTMALAGAKSG